MHSIALCARNIIYGIAYKKNIICSKLLLMGCQSVMGCHRGKNDFTINIIRA